jgi:hypothetical protein
VNEFDQLPAEERAWILTFNPTDPLSAEELEQLTEDERADYQRQVAEYVAPRADLGYLDPDDLLEPSELALVCESLLLRPEASAVFVQDLRVHWLHHAMRQDPRVLPLFQKELARRRVLGCVVRKIPAARPIGLRGGAAVAAGLAAPAD